MSIFVKVSGVWKYNILTYVKIGSTWRQVPQVYVKVSGTWRPTDVYFWVIGDWSTCSASCGGGMQYRDVICRRRRDNLEFRGEVCAAFGAGSTPATGQACNTQSCVESAYNDNTYCLYDSGHDNTVGWQTFWYGQQIFSIYQSINLPAPWPYTYGGYVYSQGVQQFNQDCYCGPWGGKRVTKWTVVRQPA